MPNLTHKDSPLGSPFLSGELVHLWLLAIPLLLPYRADLAALLDETETAKMRAFVRPQDQTQSLVSRAGLRILLAHYLGQNPREVTIMLNPFQKPLHPRIFFNVSHAQDFVLYGFSAARPLGVDIEYKKELIDLDAMISFCFTAREKESFRQLSRSERINLFYRYWTFKESAIKATGQGLNIPFKKIAIEPDRLGGHDAAQVRVHVAEGGRTKVWYTQVLSGLAAGYAGALACDSADYKMKFFQTLDFLTDMMQLKKSKN